MQAKDANTKVVSKLMFRLLPIQILLAAVGSINGIVSSYFASNDIGIDYSGFPQLLAAMEKTFTEEEIVRICRKNFLRVFSAV